MLKATMPPLLRTVLFACAVGLTAIAVRANPDFDRWADAFAADWARTNPQFATETQYFSGDLQDAVDRELTLLGDDGDIFGRRTVELRVALARRGLAELKTFPRASLRPTQRVSADVIHWALADNIASSDFTLQRFVFTQETGLHLGLVNFLTSVHPIRRTRDAENYLARLERVGPCLDEGIVQARAAATAGFLPPRFILDRTLKQIDGFLKASLRENEFVASLVARMAIPEVGITKADQARFADSAEKIVREKIIPVFTRVRAMLTDQIPASTADAGLWRLPHGEAAYRQALATFTTTSLGADEIHAIGLREVARTEREMDTLLRQLGYTDGTLMARYEKLEAASQPDSAADPRAHLLAEGLRIVRDAERRSADLFDLRPRAPIEVRREPAFSESTASEHYSVPAPDGTLPGIYWMPLPGPTFHVLRLRSVSYHEAVPGHHFQNALQQESAELPRFRKLAVFGNNSAYSEGWALYAERLADEQGWYAGDPQDRLGFLWWQLLRARRLVVDTGLHANRWTRQQAIDYGVSPQQIERYVAWPGQACSYMIGQLRIVELREKAKAKLGPAFSLKEFHNVVLGVGNVPLAVLAQEVETWAATPRPSKVKP